MESSIVKRTINGKTIGVNPSKPRQILFERVPEEFRNGDFDIREIVLYLSEGFEHTPLVLKHEITSVCQLNCPFCYIVGHTYPRHTPFSDIKPVYDWLISKGLIYAILTGGEATLNPDFPVIYRYLKENGVFVDVYTNGMAIPDSVFSLFKELPPRSVEISFYHERDKTPSPYECAEHLLRLGVHVLAKVTVTTQTVNLAPSLTSWANDIGIRLSLDNDLFSARDGESVEAFRTALNRLDPPPDQESVRQGRIPRMFNCSAGFCSVFLDSEMNLGLCPRSATRFEGNDIEDSYEMLKTFVARYKGMAFSDKCDRCTMANSCHICYARAVFNPEKNQYTPPNGYCKATV